MAKTELNTPENMKSTNDSENAMQNNKTPLVKTQSNVEKITAMLQSQNFMANGSNNNNSSSATSTTSTVQQHQKSNNSRVTINIAQNNNKNNTPTANIGNCKTQLRKLESTPIVGILKNGTGGGGTSTTSINNNHLNPEQGKITFGNAK